MKYEFAIFILLLFLLGGGLLDDDDDDDDDGIGPGPVAGYIYIIKQIKRDFILYCTERIYRLKYNKY